MFQIKTLTKAIPDWSYAIWIMLKHM